MSATPPIHLCSHGGEVRRHRHAHHPFVPPVTGVLEFDLPAGERRAVPATLAGAPPDVARGGNRSVVPGSVAPVTMR